MHLAGAHVEAHGFERLDAGKGFADARQLENRRDLALHDLMSSHRSSDGDRMMSDRAQRSIPLRAGPIVRAWSCFVSVTATYM
jgi:hypothetical protein